MEKSHSSGAGDDKTETMTAQSLLAVLRTNYLQARPPQQIGELVNLFRRRRNHVSVTASSVEPSSLPPQPLADLSITPGSDQDSSAKIKMPPEEDLDKLGIMTKKIKPILTEMGGNTFKEVTPGSKNISQEDIMLALQNLHSVTVGFSPEAQRIEQSRMEDVDESNFLHPPVQYRIAFAKHVIKQV